MTTRFFSALGLLLVCNGAALAADDRGNYAIWGVGRTSCHQFAKAVAADDDKRYKDYLMGYLTAFNTLSENTYDVTGGKKLTDATGWINNYCELHQIESFDRAIQQYVTEQFETRHQTPPGRNLGWGAK